MSTSSRSSARTAATAPSQSSGSETRLASPSTPDRRRFALAGRSIRIDPKRDAARRDIADIALAGRYFAPHYAVPEGFACGPAATDIKAAPSAAAPRTSQLLPGEAFCAVETSGGWAWGYSGHDHYVGYVEASALTAPVPATHVVAAPAALLFAAPDIRGVLSAVLPVGSRVAGTLAGEFLETGAGYLHRLHVRPVDDPVPDPVALAERLVGMPYLWGGRGAGGLDCSGLVQLAYGLAGIALPRDSDQQMAAGVATGDVRRGDLLLWSDHVVIVRDDASVIHATSHAMAVIVEPLSDLVARAGPPVARRRVM